jgi:hypothetical protein
MEVVVAPLLHNKEPVNEFAVNVELPQLFTTVTPGAAGTGFTVSVAALELTALVLLVHTARYCLLLSAVAATNANVPLVAPEIFDHVVPFVLTCHCTVGTGVPVADEIKLTLIPAHTVCDNGCVVTVGATPLVPPVLNTTSTQ